MSSNKIQDSGFLESARSSSANVFEEAKERGDKVIMELEPEVKDLYINYLTNRLEKVDSYKEYLKSQLSEKEQSSSGLVDRHYKESEEEKRIYRALIMDIGANRVDRFREFLCVEVRNSMFMAKPVFSFTSDAVHRRVTIDALNDGYEICETLLTPIDPDTAKEYQKEIINAGRRIGAVSTL